MPFDEASSRVRCSCETGPWLPACFLAAPAFASRPNKPQVLNDEELLLLETVYRQRKRPG